MCEQLLANPLIESYEIELERRVSEPRRPAIAVVVFPGSNDDRDAQLALERLGADARARLARGGRAARTRRRRSSCPAASRTATTCAAARSPASRRSWRAVDARSPPTAGSCSGSATASRSSPRPACSRACCGRTRRWRSSAATSRSRVERDGHAVHVALRARADAHDPGQARRGLLVRRRRAARGARGERPDPAPLRAGREPERLGRRRGRRRATRPGNVFGLMPHPEHAVDPLLGSTDGALILGSLVDAARLSSRGARLGLASRSQAERRRRARESLRRAPRAAARRRARAASPGRAGRRRRSCRRMRTSRSPRSVLEQLDDRREALVAGALGDLHLARPPSPGPTASLPASCAAMGTTLARNL